MAKRLAVRFQQPTEPITADTQVDRFGRIDGARFVSIEIEHHPGCDGSCGAEDAASLCFTTTHDMLSRAASIAREYREGGQSYLESAHPQSPAAIVIPWLDAGSVPDESELVAVGGNATTPNEATIAQSMLNTPAGRVLFVQATELFGEQDAAEAFDLLDMLCDRTAGAVMTGASRQPGQPEHLAVIGPLSGLAVPVSASDHAGVALEGFGGVSVDDLLL